MQHKNLWDAAKSVLIGKFIPINILNKQKRPQVNNLTLQLKELKKEQNP